MAAADLLAEIAPGLTLAETARLAEAFAQALRAGEGAGWPGPLAPLRLFAPLHDTPSRIACALLPFQALTGALAAEAPGHG